MAKQRQQFTAKSALDAVLGAIDIEGKRLAGEEIDMDDYKAKISGVKNIVGNSNMVTAMENLDDNIELQHQIAAEAEAEAENIAPPAIEEEDNIEY